MELLLVDRTAEGQSSLANRVGKFDYLDQETLDLHVRLSGIQDYKQKLPGTEALVLGPELGGEARTVARIARETIPNIHIIMIVSEEDYSSGVFRVAHVERVRKVLPASSSPLDLLQELISIQESFREDGKLRHGKVIVFTQAKGGVGTTTICGALSEVCHNAHKKTLAWDLDIETRDLCRGLTVSGIQSAVVSSWIKGSMELTKQSFKEAVIPVTDYLSVLMPPSSLAASIDMVGNPDCYNLADRILSLARCSYDNIIVDTAGRVGPAAGAIMRAADAIVVVVDDSLLGMTAVAAFIDSMTGFLQSSVPIRFLCSGTHLSKDEIRQAIDPSHTFESDSWQLEPVPVDSAGQKWPGSHKTLYSLGRRSTRSAFDRLAVQLGLTVSDSKIVDIARLRPSRAGLDPEARGAAGTTAVA